jgi:hypothetical protein
MGDVLYRLSQPESAAKQWQRAKDRLDQSQSSREDLKNLRLQLLQKLHQQQNGQPVDVAPTATTPAASTQARK